MKLRVWTFSLLIMLVAALWPTRVKAEEKSRHVVMISIDGLRPEIYLDPERIGTKVPNLVKLRKQGVSAERMIPVFPSVTYPGNTTLVTGVSPATHGIVNNFKRGSEWYLSAADIKAKTLWQVAREKGLITAIVTWRSLRLSGEGRLHVHGGAKRDAADSCRRAQRHARISAIDARDGDRFYHQRYGRA